MHWGKKHCRKHADAVPEGVERMLTKVSEEEQERGLAIAPPPHEARSRSGGSWGSSNPGADMAGCDCASRRAPGSSSRSLSLHRLRLYHLKRSEGEASGLAGAGTQRQLGR